ncbi:NAD(P)/FAD-dependent oxidoreductase [Marinomonas posidonica]|uniref:HI0933 family protein n=1 Tax=Marinomonas posidonica (strain CECT 7376 / NCIMB 14433 / IVIA-Po-181) TaxID=491952 RepID=F6CZU9_MARPP|nr:NAD(P)/FAD-dependent oxidoreductase [Marinomonas posidonica]AEF53610.1 HI0933 family protein [Marinomonas posidonica IVIA-Po-181]
MNNLNGNFDVAIIGAGPSGAVAAAQLARNGHKVLVLEKQHFPRFSIGESLLPQSMELLEQAGMLQAVVEAGFQFKNGAAFANKGLYDFFDFREKFSPGWGTTYQVQRAQFDKILADCATKDGAEIRYGHAVESYTEIDDNSVQLHVYDEQQNEYDITAKFVLDASGFGRVLPKLLNLEKESTLSTRISLFTHIEDRIGLKYFDRNKILISVHPENNEIWYWLIPFSDGRASVGVVLPRTIYEQHQHQEDADILKYFIYQTGKMSESLTEAVFDTPVGKLAGYSSDVTQMSGKHFALLGNAGEFLDPVFSSGVTIALKSAILAAETLDKQLRGEQVNWKNDFEQPLKLGIDTFRQFVEGWYDGSLQTVIFTKDKNPAVKAMICSVLAGYAWDTSNPYVKNPKRLHVLAQLCQK